MKLEIWGLGYAGLVCAAGFAHRGHRVVGVDIDALRISGLNRGEACILEPGLSARVAAAVASGRLAGATADGLGDAQPDAYMLCLPTPSTADGGLDTRAILAASVSIAERLRAARHFQTVIVRSTVPVHFTARELRPLLEASSGKIAGRDFGLAMVPEFVREGEALPDFDQPSLIVLGADDDLSRAAIAPLFEHDRCAAQHVATGVAELFKLTNNAFHALKIAFANELARLAHNQQLDGHQVIRLLCEDVRFNLSAAYLQPGYAFGGACLAKDLAALCIAAAPLESPLLAAISTSNRAHLNACLEAIRAQPYRRPGFYGITNKAGSDDLRHSPVLALIALLGAPHGALCVCDPDLGSAGAQILREQYGVTVVPDLAALREKCDFIVNFRTRPLPLPREYPQLHFASFWRGHPRKELQAMENSDLQIRST